MQQEARSGRLFFEYILMQADLALLADLPEGVLNVLSGCGDPAGAALAAHADLNHVRLRDGLQTWTLAVVFVRLCSTYNAWACVLPLLICELEEAGCNAILCPLCSWGSQARLR